MEPLKVLQRFQKSVELKNLYRVFFSESALESLSKYLSVKIVFSR